MATLLELTAQADRVTPTGTGEDRIPRIPLMDPQQLYELWERQPWSAHAIDLTRDRDHWAALGERQREHLSWNLSSFFIGEERVTNEFSGLVRAAESQGEAAYLTTQQVDEARHAQLFDRLYHEVLGCDGTFEARLDHARHHLSEPFRVLFDERLTDAHRRLLADPGDPGAKIDFVVLYHMVIEGTLALTGQEFLTRRLEAAGLLPGFLDGFANVARDEHRHVAYGTWFLREKVREDPRHASRIQAALLDVLPAASAVFMPAGGYDGPEAELMGAPATEVNRFAFTALWRRLKVIGVALPAAA